MERELRPARDAQAAVLPPDVLRGDSQEVGGHAAGLLLQPLGRVDDGRAPDGHRAAGEAAEALRDLRGVAGADRDVVGANAQRVGGYLREDRLVPLAVWGRADADDDPAAG